jgi:hypothetical protein
MVEALRLLGAVTLVAWLSACSATTKPNVRDSNSNWLATCEVTADCKGDGTCICGLCTATCRDDGDCESAGTGASCVRPGDATEEVGCAAIVESARENVCLAECAHDDDCRAGSSCVEGACWAMPSTVIDRRDGGDEPDPPLGVDTRPDIWALDASVDFGEPVAAPVPETELEGELSASLVGVWNEVQGVHTYWASPIQLEIKADGAGRVTGTVAFLCEDETCNPRGPIPPASDPDASYPPGVDVGTYDVVRLNGMPHVPYRMFDARLQGGRFAFWTTNNDLWRDWCSLQTPFPVTIEGRRMYSCTPDARPFSELFEVEGVEDKDVLCALDWGPCRCTAERCAIDYQGATRLFDLRVEGDSMTGVHQTVNDFYVVTFEREGAAP